MSQGLAWIVPFFLLSLACNDQHPQENTDGNRSADTGTHNQVQVGNPGSACYSSSENQNRIELQLIFRHDSVTGTMQYEIAGKDKNKGTLKGAVRGDSIFAEYSFSSEGKMSVRQVAFLQKQDSLLEGYGDVEEQAGRMVFKNTSTLNYGKGVVLKKMDCPL